MSNKLRLTATQFYGKNLWTNLNLNMTQIQIRFLKLITRTSLIKKAFLVALLVVFTAMNAMKIFHLKILNNLVIKTHFSCWLKMDKKKVQNKNCVCSVNLIMQTKFTKKSSRSNKIPANQKKSSVASIWLQKVLLFILNTIMMKLLQKLSIFIWNFLTWINLIRDAI